MTFAINIRVEKMSEGKFKIIYNTEGEPQSREEYLDALCNALSGIDQLFHDRCVRLSYPGDS